jgi:DDE superfamily endonuclease
MSYDGHKNSGICMHVLPLVLPDRNRVVVLWPICKDSSATLLAKIAGRLPSMPEKTCPQGCSGYLPAPCGTLISFVMTCVLTSWSTLVILRRSSRLMRTSFPKRGRKSAGVRRQYCGATKRPENCQVGVFLSYVSKKGHTLLDRELSIPKRWFDDRQRCREAGIPETTRFQTKCELARMMLERVHQAHLPISWVVADTVYGSNQDLRDWLELQGYHFVLAVACDEAVEIMTSGGCRRMTVTQAQTCVLQAHDW